MLTDTAIRKAKPTSKRCRLWDAGGLYLEVTPAGGKWWRWKYRLGGKEKRLSLGTYPDTSLASARAKRDAARQMLADGIDPSEARKAEKTAGQNRAANTFEAVAREWYAKHQAQWALTHASKIIRRFEKDVFPWLGGKPVDAITAPDLLQTARRIESRGAIETAHRAIQTSGQVIRYAIATGRASTDPTPALRGALTPPAKGHFAALTEPAALGELLRAIDGFTGQFATRCALQLAALLFVRPGELRQAEWQAIDLDAGEWRYHVTKTDIDHIVPLPRQALAILRDLQPLTGRGRYLFPGARAHTRPLSDAALSAALARLGYKGVASVHGFRATARTMLDECLGFRPDFIEHQLAHAVRDPNGRAYNRTTHLNDRRAMMQAWADYLDALKAGSNVVSIGRATARV